MEIAFVTKSAVVSGEEIPDGWLRELSDRVRDAGLSGIVQELDLARRDGRRVEIPGDEAPGLEAVLTGWLLELPAEASAERGAVERLRDALRRR